MLADVVCSASSVAMLQMNANDVAASDAALTQLCHEGLEQLENNVAAETLVPAQGLARPELQKTAAQLKEELEARCLQLIADCHDGDELRGPIVEKLRPMVAESAALTDKVARQLASRYVSITGAKGTWTTRTIAKFLREVPRTAAPASTFDLTHVGVAQTIVREHDGNLLKVVDFEKNSWMQWEGCRWTPLMDTELGTLVAERLDVIKADLTTDPAFDEKAYREAVRMLGHNSFTHGVCGQMEFQRAAHVRQSQLDLHRDYLTMANGAVHIPTGELVAKRELLLTLPNDVEYDGDAKCPVFLRVLEEVFPEGTDERDWFELVFGYTMCGKPTEKAVFIHKGEGDNGKSMFLNAIMGAMGAHATSSPDSLVASDERGASGTDGNAPSPMLHNLKNRRMAYIDEIEDGKVLKDGFVRQIASGLGKLSGRRLGGQLEHFDITVVLHITCNNLARVRAAQRAVFERLCPVVYSVQFDKRKQDTSLPEQLANEKAGIFNWLLECARKYLKFKESGNTLKAVMPDSSKAELDALQREQSNLQDWIEACCIKAPNAFINPADGAASFNDYLRRFDKDSKAVFKSPKGFTSRMKAERISGIHHAEQVETEQRRGDRQSGFWGITLKDSPQYAAVPRKASTKNGVPDVNAFNRPASPDQLVS